MLRLTPEIAEDLQYAVELWGPGGRLERVLAAAVRSDIGRAAFDGACQAFPDQEITLRQGCRVLASTKDSPTR